MLKFKNNRYLLLLQDEFRRIVTEEHPELIKDGETLTKIDITKDRLSRYLSSKDEEISIPHPPLFQNGGQSRQHEVW